MMVFLLLNPTTTTQTGHYSDSGILMSDDMTCYEETTTSVILRSNTNKLSSASTGNKSTYHYAEIEVPTIILELHPLMMFQYNMLIFVDISIQW